MHFAESPAAHEQLDHAKGRGARCLGHVDARFDDNPSVAGRIGCGSFTGFDNRSGQRLMFMQMEKQSYVERAVDSVYAHFSIALRRMPIAATEQRACVIDRQIERGARAKFPYVEIAPERSRWTCAESAIVCACHSHHAEKGPHRHNRWLEGSRFLAFEQPVKKVSFLEAILQKAKALHHAAPSPATMTSGQNVNLQYEIVRAP